MRQFTINHTALMNLLEIIETYDCIRSTFPSIDIEDYLSKTFSKLSQEYVTHAKLLLGIYIHEEHSEIIHRPYPRPTNDNEVIITIDVDKMQSIEPRLLKEGRIESLIEQEILQEVKIVMLSSKELEDLDNILRHVNKFYDNPQENYLDLNLTQGQLDHMIAKFKQKN